MLKGMTAYRGGREDRRVIFSSKEKKKKKETIKCIIWRIKHKIHEQRGLN